MFTFIQILITNSDGIHIYSFKEIKKLYENEEYNSPPLTLPHPRMFERGFVLIPLLDIDFQNALFDRDIIKNSVVTDGVRLFAHKSALNIQNKR